MLEKIQILLFRYADKIMSPRWFLKQVPSVDDIIAYSGNLAIEIVSHCWNYSHLLVYNLSSYVNHPPTKTKVTVTVFYSKSDQKTSKILNHFSNIKVKNVTWNWQEIPTDQLLRRAIGRNKAALHTKANWIWFIDCDLIFGKGCLDSLADTLQNRKDFLLFPQAENVTDLLKGDNKILQISNKPQIVNIDSKMFYPKNITRAVGAYQIVHADIARSCGYCNNIAAYQTPSMHWQKTFEDRTFRWLIGTHGTAIDIPHIYRIRHIAKGRYKKNSRWSRIRAYIRLMQS